MAIGNDGVAGRDAGLDHSLRSNAAAGFYDTRLHGRILFYDIDKRAFLTILNGFRRDHGRILDRVQRQNNIHELPGPQRAIAVVESRLETDPARPGVNGVIYNR